MEAVLAILWAVDHLAHELALFAGVGIVLGGAGDLAVDLFWIGRTLWRRATVYRRHPRATAATLAAPARPGMIAVFVPAWREADVIGAMLRHALAAWEGASVRIYVGVYPNDPATIAAVRGIADPRVRMVVNARAGGTTKGDNLNSMWSAMRADETQAGAPMKAVVLHDAEDLVHADEIRIFDTLIERFDLVQLPVVALVDARCSLMERMIGGHYADEFAEAHGRTLVVREALGAAMPSAGVGCAFSRARLGAVAAARGGLPFDAESLTEDYELGLRIGEAGGRGVFVRLREADGGDVVAVRAHFPVSLDAAVRQKGRWMTGIALAGWRRLGWRGSLAERWMRFRDRQAVLAALVLVAAYGALIGWTILFLGETFAGYRPTPLTGFERMLLIATTGLLGWRLAMRALFVGRVHGWRQAFASLPRAIVANIIAMMAARRALAHYLHMARRADGVGEDDARLPRRGWRAMTGGGPLRFLGLVAMLWVGVRVATVLPGLVGLPEMSFATPVPARAAERALPEPALVVALPDPVRPAVALALPRALSASSSGARASPPVAAQMIEASGYGRPPSLAGLRYPDGASGPIAIWRERPARARPILSRWTVTGWMVARDGGGARSLAGTGQLGGSQAGLRASYAIGTSRTLAIAARLSSPLSGGAGREAAIGIDWQPSLSIPMKIVAEQRFALSDGGRSGPALGIVGGLGGIPLPADFTLDAYGQAGVVGIARPAGYVDAAVRMERPVWRSGGVSLALGFGAWGAAQPGVARVDVGPQAVLRVPAGGTTLRVGLDWRERIAGNARPGSGPALSVGADF